MNLKTVAEVEYKLQEFVSLVSKYSGDNLSLDRMWPILELAGNPHKIFKVIHVAGTSGKTSTAYYISALIEAAGLKVGLSVSPHIDSIAERVQINNKNIDDNLFVDEFNEFLGIIGKSEIKPSYFELMIIFALWEFARNEVDYVVLETGMGGLLDGSNVVTRTDKICVITDIGFDHMHILGNTLSDISAQKAGIIHKNNQVIMYEQSSEVMSQIHKRADKKSVKLIQVTDTKSKIPTLSQLPDFQIRNFNLALKTYELLSHRDNLIKSDDLLAKFDPTCVAVPARMQILSLGNQSTLILDGAHNGQKMLTFVNSYKKKYGEKKATVMLALKTGKEFTEVIDCLSSITSNFILTTFNTSQDLPAVAQDPLVIQEYILKNHKIKTELISNNEDALNKLLKDKNDMKIITGSFYLIGQIRKLLKDIIPQAK